MREPKCNRGLRPAVSLSAALAVHALVAWVAWRIPVPPAAVQAIPEVAVEFALLAPPLVPEPPPTPASGTPAVASLRASEIGRGTRTDSPAHGEPTPEIGEVLDAPDGSAPAIPAPPAPKVELGLDGAVVNRFLLEGRKPETRRQARARASLMLREELDALDAAKGVGRSSTALRAAERASSSAPLLGSATFDVRADASGRVISVALLTFGSDGEKWQRVRASMERELRTRRVRVPPGATGLSTVVRIERGEMALDPNDRGRKKRGAGIGGRSLGPKDSVDESTRASFENGALAPTLGAGSDSLRKSVETRVVLLHERAL